MGNFTQDVLDRLEIQEDDLNFGDIRSLLHNSEPSRRSFKDLQYALEVLLKASPDLENQLISYVSDHLKSWPDEVKVLERNFPHRSVENLAHSIEPNSKKSFEKLAAGLWPFETVYLKTSNIEPLALYGYCDHILHWKIRVHHLEPRLHILRRFLNKHPLSWETLEILHGDYEAQNDSSERVISFNETCQEMFGDRYIGCRFDMASMDPRTLRLMRS